MTRYFEVEWHDLSDEKREEMIESAFDTLREEAQIEGEALFKKEWHNPQPVTWQEAYCRDNWIESIMWEGYHYQKPEHEVPKTEDWAYWLEEYLRERAEQKCFEAMRHNEIEVEL